MRKVLTAVVLLPVAAVLVVFALANREAVILSADPFTPGSAGWSIELPLFVVIIVSVMLGVLVGAATDWVGQRRYRREARFGRSEVKRLEQEAAALRRTHQPPPSGSNLPVHYEGS